MKITIHNETRAVQFEIGDKVVVSDLGLVITVERSDDHEVEMTVMSGEKILVQVQATEDGRATSVACDQRQTTVLGLSLFGARR